MIGPLEKAFPVANLWKLRVSPGLGAAASLAALGLSCEPKIHSLALGAQAKRIGGLSAI